MGRKEANNHRYFVSRQMPWSEDYYMVEVVSGGSDNASPDMLSEKFAGEGQEYEDPREAAEAAIRIAVAWRKTKPNKQVFIGFGNTLGGSFGIEPSPRKKEKKEIKEWAEKIYEEIPQCDHCGKKMFSSERYTHPLNSEGEFCKEYCAEEDYAAQIKFDEELREEND